MSHTSPWGPQAPPCPVPCVSGLLKRAWEPCERGRAAGHGEPRAPLAPRGLSTLPPPRLNTGTTNESSPRPRFPPSGSLFPAPLCSPPPPAPTTSLCRSLVTVGTTWAPRRRRRARGCGHTQVRVLKRAAGFGGALLTGWPRRAPIGSWHVGVARGCGSGQWGRGARAAGGAGGERRRGP